MAQMTLEEMQTTIKRLQARVIALEGRSTVLTVDCPCDTTAPDAPTNFAGTADYQSITLTWDASTDDVGVDHYNLYSVVTSADPADPTGTTTITTVTLIATTQALTYIYINLAASTAYTFRLSASDYAGNESAVTSDLTVTTDALPADTTPPTTPTGLAYSSLTTTSAVLTWNASSDDRSGIAGYTLYRNGTPIASPNALTYSDTALVPSTQYIYTVDAVDGAGNHSGQSTSVIVVTLSPPVTDTYYVDATLGSSSNDGSVGSPWTLDYALNGGGGGAVQSGNTIYLRAGTYNIGAVQDITGLTGGAGNTICVKNYPGERVTIRNTGGSTPCNTWLLKNVSYVDFSGLEFTMNGYDRSTESGAATDMAHINEDSGSTQAHVNFYGCTFHDSQGRAVKTIPGSNDVTYNGCYFYFNGSYHAGDFAALVQSDTGNTKTFRDCVFFHNAGDALRVYSTDSSKMEGITLDGNVFGGLGSLYTNPSAAILAAGDTVAPKSLTIENNMVSLMGVNPDGDSKAIQVGDINSGGGTITPSVSASGDDGRFYSDTTFNTSGTTVEMGYASSVGHSGWMRFLNITIPQGATITAAALTLVPALTRSASVCKGTIAGDKSAVSPTAPSDYTDASTRARTTATVAWTVAAQTAGTPLDSPDITTVIQEIVDQGSWASGNALQIFLDYDNTATNYSGFASYDHATYDPPLLSITYENDAGADTVSITANFTAGMPIDLAGTNYTSVTASGNTFYYGGAHSGNTATDFAAGNTFADCPTTGQRIFTRAFSWDDQRGNIVIFNFAGTTSVTISATDLVGLNIQAGDLYELHNAEDYYSDVIAGTYNGASITVDMTTRTVAKPQTLAKPVSAFPYFACFNVIVKNGGGSGGGGGADTTPPSAPGSLSATAVSDSEIDLTWTAATDDVAVTGYRIYRDSVNVGGTTGLSFSDTGLNPSTSYSYYVTAVDAAGNESSASNTDSDTTSALTGYYVSSTGSSSNSGTQASPWSLSYALTGAGGTIAGDDTIWLMDGTYSVGSAILATVSGTSGHPVKFKALAGARVTIKQTATGYHTIDLRGTQHVYFYDLEFTMTGYTRTTQTATSALEGFVVTDTNYTQDDVKFYGCVFHDQKGMALKNWESVTSGMEFNGCLVYYSGNDPQHDHNAYVHNDTNEKLFKDCVFHNPASHNFHAYDDGSRPVNHISLVGSVFFAPNSLYGSTSKRSVLIGGNGSNLSYPKVDHCYFYSPNSSAEHIRIGYGSNTVSNVTLTDNFSVGRPWYLENTWSGGTNTCSNNTVYSNTSNGSNTQTHLTGSGNVTGSVPSSGTHTFIRAYDWDSRRGNVTIFNLGSASNITLLDSDLQAAGLTLAAGDTYELHNAEDYFSDVLTGTYNGTSISVPMTGRTQATPAGGLSKPTTMFPKFGCFLLKITAG